MKNDLTIISVVENDRGLINLMIDSVRKFTKPSPHFILCDNGHNGIILEKHRHDPLIKIVPHIPTLSGGSNRHGQSLNKIFPMVETGKTAIIESDCIVLSEKWHDLDLSKYKMASAIKNYNQGIMCYHMCFMLFGTNIMKHGDLIDFRPGKDSNRGNRNYKPWEDVGWGIQKKIGEIQIKKLDFVDTKTGLGQYFGREFQSDELWFNNIPIVAHFGRGSNLAGKAIHKGFESPERQLEMWKNKAKDIIG